MMLYNGIFCPVFLYNNICYDLILHYICIQLPRHGRREQLRHMGGRQLSEAFGGRAGGGGGGGGSQRFGNSEYG